MDGWRRRKSEREKETEKEQPVRRQRDSAAGGTGDECRRASGDVIGGDAQ